MDKKKTWKGWPIKKSGIGTFGHVDMCPCDLGARDAQLKIKNIGVTELRLFLLKKMLRFRVFLGFNWLFRRQKMIFSKKGKLLQARFGVYFSSQKKKCLNS